MWNEGPWAHNTAHDQDPAGKNTGSQSACLVLSPSCGNSVADCGQVTISPCDSILVCSPVNFLEVKVCITPLSEPPASSTFSGTHNDCRLFITIHCLNEKEKLGHDSPWCCSWSSNTLATWCKELTHWKRPWCWERLKTGEGDDKGWDGWMASPTRWTSVWGGSRSWWWTGKPDVLQSTGSQRVGHDWATEMTEFHYMNIA